MTSLKINGAHYQAEIIPVVLDKHTDEPSKSDFDQPFQDEICFRMVNPARNQPRFFVARLQGDLPFSAEQTVKIEIGVGKQTVTGRAEVVWKDDELPNDSFNIGQMKIHFGVKESDGRFTEIDPKNYPGVNLQDLGEALLDESDLKTGESISYVQYRDLKDLLRNNMGDRIGLLDIAISKSRDHKVNVDFYVTPPAHKVKLGQNFTLIDPQSIGMTASEREASVRKSQGKIETLFLEAFHDRNLGKTMPKVISVNMTNITEGMNRLAELLSQSNDFYLGNLGELKFSTAGSIQIQGMQVWAISAESLTTVKFVQLDGNRTTETEELFPVKDFDFQFFTPPNKINTSKNIALLESYCARKGLLFDKANIIIGTSDRASVDVQIVAGVRRAPKQVKIAKDLGPSTKDLEANFLDEHLGYVTNKSIEDGLIRLTAWVQEQGYQFTEMPKPAMREDCLNVNFTLTQITNINNIKIAIIDETRGPLQVEQVVVTKANADFIKQFRRVSAELKTEIMSELAKYPFYKDRLVQAIISRIEAREHFTISYKLTTSHSGETKLAIFVKDDPRLRLDWQAKGQLAPGDATSALTGQVGGYLQFRHLLRSDKDLIYGVSGSYLRESNPYERELAPAGNLTEYVTLKQYLDDGSDLSTTLSATQTINSFRPHGLSLFSELKTPLLDKFSRLKSIAGLGLDYSFGGDARGTEQGVWLIPELGLHYAAQGLKLKVTDQHWLQLNSGTNYNQLEGRFRWELPLTQNELFKFDLNGIAGLQFPTSEGGVPKTSQYWGVDLGPTTFSPYPFKYGTNLASLSTALLLDLTRLVPKFPILIGGGISLTVQPGDKFADAIFGAGLEFEFPALNLRSRVSLYSNSPFSDQPASEQQPALMLISERPF